MATELFEDIFEVRQLNPDGKKFDKGEWMLLRVSVAAAPLGRVWG